MSKKTAPLPDGRITKVVSICFFSVSLYWYFPLLICFNCLQFNLYIKQTSNSASWSIYHNGSEYSTSGFPHIRVFRNDGDANDETIGCCWIFRYTAGDYLEIRSSGQTSEYVPARSYFSGFLVG